jgi:hypothetical protein
MPDLNVLAVLVGTVALFVIGAAYYATFGAQLAQVSDAAAAAGSMRPWQVAVEFLRCLILALVVAGLAAKANVVGLAEGLLLGLVLWIGFPFVLWTGAVVHERTPVKLAAIHAGDWLVKLLVVAVLVSVWPSGSTDVSG